jgi:hypothetical protein
MHPTLLQQIAEQRIARWHAEATACRLRRTLRRATRQTDRSSHNRIIRQPNGA